MVAMLLARLLERRGYRARSIAIGTTSEMFLQVATRTRESFVFRPSGLSPSAMPALCMQN
jgi:hypothetical protein